MWAQSSHWDKMPKPFIEQCGFGGTVHLHMEKWPARRLRGPGASSRMGWGFLAAGAGQPLMSYLLECSAENRSDRKEWNW
jgi:hypothetical protein